MGSTPICIYCLAYRYCFSVNRTPTQEHLHTHQVNWFGFDFVFQYHTVCHPPVDGFVSVFVIYFYIFLHMYWLFSRSRKYLNFSICLALIEPSPRAQFFCFYFLFFSIYIIFLFYFLIFFLGFYKLNYRLRCEFLFNTSAWAFVCLFFFFSTKNDTATSTIFE